MSRYRPDKLKGGGADSTALAAVALQDHLVRSLNLNFGNVKTFGPRNIGLGPAARSKQRSQPRAVVDTGRNRSQKAKPKKKEEDEEYVLDPLKVPKLSLAQKMGLVDAPEQPLSEQEWISVKEKSNKRDDSKQPCVICKEDFGTQEQVLLSCTHVFHKACLQAFERFTGRKTCPMCRNAEYQTRVIHEGAKEYRIICATKIQAAWRGYVVKCWYRKLRESVPPNDPKLRQKFYEEKLSSITDRIVRSCDFNVNTFLTEIDQSLQASRDIFRRFDEKFHVINDDEWEAIQLRAVQRETQDCPICLTSLVSQTYIHPSCSDKRSGSAKEKTTISNTKQTPSNRNKTAASKQASLGAVRPKSLKREEKEVHESGTTKKRKTVLLSCSHVFHEQCLQTFEELSLQDGHHACPVCRSIYQKKSISI
ncbi:RING finger protein 32-like [Mizuhopecten yessoensis]|uniref:RING finger protein 32 n=1 Tax=Mizuhopecten yessoensis TaxID=6573 RepID=A0A210PHJ9_MIZYE|nr:RING finger protein 32-like [Mizuhopecten yessoensis]OWF35952.1 RING finger protein 32 [Mizuhopecten yessoensis]